MKCSFKRLIHARPQTVWHILTNITDVPYRFPEFEGWTIAHDPRGADLIAVSHDRLNKGGEIKYVVRLTALEPGRTIEAEYLEANLESTGNTVFYALEPLPEGTGLYVVLDAKQIVGFVYMFFVIRRYLNRLKEVAEGA